MQQRRPRLGDILDDYCPRERRITNHAVVAMIDDQVKQTRCSTCDSDHVYKQGKAPTPRRKKDVAPAGKVTDKARRTRKIAPAGDPTETPPMAESPGPELVAAEPLDASELAEIPETAAPDDASVVDIVAPIDLAPVVEGVGTGDSVAGDSVAGDNVGGVDDLAVIDDDLVEDTRDDGPVHRPLIRATLPRPEGQVPERKSPEFTVRQPGGRGGREFDGNGPGQQRPGRGRRPMRPGQGNGAGQSRFGPPHQGNPPRHGSGQGQGQRQDGNRPGPPGGQRGTGRPPGEGGRGPGRKRGR